jgi:hypothetical protein
MALASKSEASTPKLIAVNKRWFSVATIEAEPGFITRFSLVMSEALALNEHRIAAPKINGVKYFILNSVMLIG